MSKINIQESLEEIESLIGAGNDLFNSYISKFYQIYKSQEDANRRLLKRVKELEEELLAQTEEYTKELLRLNGSK